MSSDHPPLETPVTWLDFQEVKNSSGGGDDNNCARRLCYDDAEEEKNTQHGYSKSSEVVRGTTEAVKSS